MPHTVQLITFIATAQFEVLLDVLGLVGSTTVEVVGRPGKVQVEGTGFTALVWFGIVELFDRG
jgi:hypothetical protein